MLSWQRDPVCFIRKKKTESASHVVMTTWLCFFIKGITSIWMRNCFVFFNVSWLIFWNAKQYLIQIPVITGFALPNFQFNRRWTLIRLHTHYFIHVMLYLMQATYNYQNLLLILIIYVPYPLTLNYILLLLGNIT